MGPIHSENTSESYSEVKCLRLSLLLRTSGVKIPRKDMVLYGVRNVECKLNARRDGATLSMGSGWLHHSRSVMRSHMADHFQLVHFPHGLLHLLEEHLRYATTQGVDRVQKLGLDGVEQRLEEVVLQWKL